MNLNKNIKPSLFAFSCCRQGASHIKENKVCQDFAISNFAEKYAVAIVCDGHGGRSYFRSDIGSRFAAESARESIRTFMKEIINSGKLGEQVKADPDKYLKQLETNILYEWKRKIEDHFKNNPFREEELCELSDADRQKYEQKEPRYIKAYGTTMIAVVVYPGNFWFGLHIGDGKCVARFLDNHSEQPIPWDDKCFLNVTTSLCDDEALKEFRHCFHPDNFPVALFVGSDGIDDSFTNDDDLYDFYGEIVQTFKEKKRKAVEEIKAFLPELSKRGSQDDVSVAGIIIIRNLILIK